MYFPLHATYRFQLQFPISKMKWSIKSREYLTVNVPLCAAKGSCQYLYSVRCLSSRRSYLHGHKQLLKEKAPTFYKTLVSIVSHSAVRNKLKKGESQYPGLCTAVAILLKEHNREMSGIQSYVSSVLFSKHIHKKVSVSLTPGLFFSLT